MRNTSGLRPPWPKGKSGNPGGKPKQKPLTEALERLLVDGVVPADATGVASLFVGQKWADVVARGLVTAAIGGDAPAFREAADRVEGKIPQGVEHSGEVATRYVVEVPPEETRDEWLARHTKARELADAAETGGVN